MKNRNILLLGGGGFLGQALAESLCLDDMKVHIVSPHVPDFFHRNIQFYQGSLDNKNILNETLPLCGNIVHLASTTTPGDSINDPTIEVAQNIFPTIRFLDFLSGFENQRLIYVSSGGAIYDSESRRPLKETDSLHPLSYYGAGKLSVEFFLQALSNMKKNNIAILRPSNLYGPGQPYRKGFGLICTILNKLIFDNILEVWGDGKIIRDFIYIADMIDVIKRIIRNPEITGVYNISSNMGHSINEVIRISEMVCNKKINVKFVKERTVDIKSVVLDNSKICEKTGWEPETSLESGIRLTWNWLTNKKNDSGNE